MLFNFPFFFFFFNEGPKINEGFFLKQNKKKTWPIFDKGKCLLFQCAGTAVKYVQICIFDKSKCLLFQCAGTAVK